jgi:hypothetical protein
MSKTDKSKRYVCTNCENTFESASKPLHCPRCNASGKSIVDFAHRFLGRVKVTISEPSGKLVRFSENRGKKSLDGRPAKDSLYIDVEKNRCIHHVKEMDENGNWKVVYHKDEPLDVHNRRKQQSKNR